MSSILDNIKRMISPLSDEDDDYEEIFDDRDSPFIDERPRSIDRGGLADSRRVKVVNIHATEHRPGLLVLQPPGQGGQYPRHDPAEGGPCEA